MSLNPVKVVDGYQEKDKLCASFETTAKRSVLFTGQRHEPKEIQPQEIYQILERYHQKEESVSLDNSQALNQSKRGSTSLGPIIPEVKHWYIGQVLEISMEYQKALVNFMHTELEVHVVARETNSIRLTQDIIYIYI